MLKVNKNKDCEQRFQALKDDPRAQNWEDVHTYSDLLERLHKVKECMLKKEQSYDGLWLCPYCERKILRIEKTQIDHIKPRHLFPRLTFAYENLLVSCDHKETCNNHKGHAWKETFINPVAEDPEPLFHYSANGEILIDKECVRDTVEILNLNHTSLVRSRRTILLQMRTYPPKYRTVLHRYFHEFPSFVRYWR